MSKLKAPRQLIDRLATELMLLRAAWIIAGDDDRRHKLLSIGPADVRRWSRLIRQAGQPAREKK
jgi:hypothetical protein